MREGPQATCPAVCLASALVTRGPKAPVADRMPSRLHPKTHAYLIFRTISICTSDIANNINPSTNPIRDDIEIAI
jgi:hypothetical protein